MDFNLAVRETASYFIRGYLQGGNSFLTLPFEDLKSFLREKYFNGYREDLKRKGIVTDFMPRTGTLISIVRSEVMVDIQEGKDLEASIKNGLEERIVQRLKKEGYSYLFDR